MFYGDDDTFYVVDPALKLLQGLDHNMPYFLTGATRMAADFYLGFLSFPIPHSLDACFEAACNLLHDASHTCKHAAQLPLLHCDSLLSTPIDQACRSCKNVTQSVPALSQEARYAFPGLQITCGGRRSGRRPTAACMKGPSTRTEPPLSACLATTRRMSQACPSPTRKAAPAPLLPSATQTPKVSIPEIPRSNKRRECSPESVQWDQSPAWYNCTGPLGHSAPFQLQ